MAKKIGRPKTQTKPINFNADLLVWQALRSDCLSKGYTRNWRGLIVPAWAEYFAAIAAAIVSKTFSVPRKG